MLRCCAHLQTPRRLVQWNSYAPCAHLQTPRRLVQWNSYAPCSLCSDVVLTSKHHEGWCNGIAMPLVLCAQMLCSPPNTTKAGATSPVLTTGTGTAWTRALTGIWWETSPTASELLGSIWDCTTVSGSGTTRST